MSSTALKKWIQQDAFPLWLEKGVDWDGLGFREALSLDGEILTPPRRGMVQARQIYCFRMVLERGWTSDVARTREALARGLDFFTTKYPRASGAFAHSVTDQGDPANDTPDLYGQAFAIFGLAQGFAVTKDPRLRELAIKVMIFLERERRLPGGGYSELRDDRRTLEANPHMHLFEAALAWMEADPGQEAWRRLADDLLTLCLGRFIDPATGALCEFFDEQGEPARIEGRFIAEPGHQYEWAWLLGWYQRLTGRDLTAVRLRLCDLSEKHGLSTTEFVYDEIWSDLSVKSKTSRFWPQCERIKALRQLGSAKAENAAEVLFRYFATPQPGLWFDRREDGGAFKQEPARASGLYHIVGAINELLG